MPTKLGLNEIEKRGAFLVLLLEVLYIYILAGNKVHACNPAATDFYYSPPSLLSRTYTTCAWTDIRPLYLYFGFSHADKLLLRRTFVRCFCTSGLPVNCKSSIYNRLWKLWCKEQPRKAEKVANSGHA